MTCALRAKFMSAWLGVLDGEAMCDEQRGKPAFLTTS